MIGTINTTEDTKIGMKNMEMTIKQLANELGVGKTTISRLITQLGLQDKLHKVGNKYMLSEIQHQFPSFRKDEWLIYRRKQRQVDFLKIWGCYRKSPKIIHAK